MVLFLWRKNAAASLWSFFFCWAHLALEWWAGALQFCRVVHFKFNTIILDLWSGHFCFAVWVNELCSISARRVLFHVGLYMSCSSLLPFPQSTKVRKLSWWYKTCTCTLRCHVGSLEGPNKLIAFYHFYILFCGGEVICQQWPCCPLWKILLSDDSLELYAISIML